MKRYSKTWFIINGILICINILMCTYFGNFSGIVAWSLVLFAEFRIRVYDVEIDKLREWENYWYKIATDKIKEDENDD